MFREYLFRTKFNVTHEQYLNEPSELVDWLISIDGIAKELRRE